MTSRNSVANSRKRWTSAKLFASPSEARIAPQHAQPEADVLDHGVQGAESALISIRLLDLFHTAKLSERGIARFFGRHSRCNVPLGQKIDMLPNLLRYFRIPAFLSKEPEQP